MRDHIYPSSSGNGYKVKVVFLDRDGVINFERKDYVKTPDEFQLIPDVVSCLKLLVDKGFKLIIVTNQSMIGRGLSTHENLHLIHRKMQNLFFENGFQVDGIYYCPHKPDDNCLCRKPEIGLFKNAMDEFCIDMENSWIIGNNETDILGGKKIGCKTIKIQTNSNLKEALSKILNNSM
jgi:histidinol-phosphate phosphatase family protein